ncbi:MAG: phage tail length tape measure family protein [Saccharospirillaceae bacterium]|nr:phage tail length tape measure family protein [Saccharospirillaceae bacterium]
MSTKMDKYVISIEGENQKLALAATQSVGQLTQVRKAANDTHGGINKLAQGVRHASTNVAAFQGPLGGVSGRLGSLATLLTSVNPLMVALGLGVSGVTLILTGAVKAFDELNIRNAKTEALLKATGNASGLTADQLDKMARSVALNTLASVEGVKDAQNVLLTFKSVSGDVFEDAITLSQDMAAVMGGDAKSSALQLGKALESPSKGLSALSRSGVSFSESQKQFIKDMEDAGRVADAQRFILETLSDQIAGAGSSEANGSVAGSLDTLGQRWQRTMQILGETPAGVVVDFFNGMANGLKRVNEWLETTDQERFNDLLAERVKLEAQLATIKSVDEAYGREDSRRAQNKQTEIDAINAEMATIQEARKKELAAETEAANAAEEYKKNKADEAAVAKAEREAKELAKTQDKHAKELAAMDLQFAAEDEKLNIQLDQRLAKIDAWQLSEQEVKARGFESMAELQAEYRDMAYEEFDAGLMAIEVREAESQRKRTKEAEEETKKRLAAEKRAQQLAYSSLQSSTGQFTSLLESAGKKNTGIYKAAFMAQKAAAIPSMITSTEEGAAKALALGPVAGPIASGAIRAMGYAGVGIVAGQTIAGAFEQGGIIPGNSYTGDNLLAMVNSREMVLNVGQQKQLFDIANGKGAGGGVGVVVNVIEDASRAGTQSRSADDQGQEIISVFVANVRSGGDAAMALESIYGMERAGTI